MTFNNRTRCPHCKRKLDTGQRIHPECIDDYAEAQEAKAERKRAKEARAAAKVQKAEDRKKRESFKKIPQLIATAQEAFNAFIRARDKDKGCFVCGKPFPLNRPGGSFDAGHVRSRGAAGHLRFNELNCHGECKECNSSFGAKPHQIKAGAIWRIGPEAYEKLENDNEPHKWQREELIQVTQKYRQKLKELQA